MKLTAQELERLEQLIEAQSKTQRSSDYVPGSRQQPLSFAELTRDRRTNLRQNSD